MANLLQAKSKKTIGEKEITLEFNNGILRKSDIKGEKHIIKEYTNRSGKPELVYLTNVLENGTEVTDFILSAEEDEDTKGYHSELDTNGDYRLYDKDGKLISETKQNEDGTWRRYEGGQFSHGTRLNSNGEMEYYTWEDEK